IPPLVVSTPTQTSMTKFTPSNGDISGDTSGEIQELYQWRKITTSNIAPITKFYYQNDDNDGEKFTTNQRRYPPPTTVTSTAKSESIINNKSHLKGP
ncbi:18349_t:CDS:1, partial [Gigaspora rosea]